ncbi:Aldo/keto reductase [Fistulina hepatica ATCC 64428]|uniref:Aldo/keto reductase n=1 Tax=Fistulina hepatica ATCC 64428 TaxID=1128425 RepID=A0A0D7A8N4_9AGAR|nr:Aldo/keto reductase [Fistulina hepatica ATCC 64428]
MPFGTLPLNDGTEIPAIAFGTGSVNKAKDAQALVTQALETGFSHIDTAAFYFNEQSVGAAIHESGLARNEFYVTTKYDGGSFSRAIRSSLHKLNLKRVDLYLIHSPKFVLSLEGAWREMEKIKDEGLSTSIGVSNFELKHLEKLVKIARIKPAVNQIEFHPYVYAERKPVLTFAAQHGIVIEGYSPLKSITRLPGGPVDAPVAAAATRLGISPAQVLLAWARSKGIVIVTTSSKKEHLEEYLAVPELPPLTDDEIAAIEEAGAQGPPTSALRKGIRWGLITFVAAYAFYLAAYTSIARA